MSGPYRKRVGSDEREGDKGLARLRRKLFPTEEERREDRERARAREETWIQDLMHRRGPSPYPWISDRLWTEWNQDGDGRAPIDMKNCPIHNRWLTVPSPDDLARAPRAPVPEGAPLPPPGTDADHNALLDSTRGGGFINLVHWPVCCDRLTTLLSWWEFGALDAATGHSGLDTCPLEANTANRMSREELLDDWRDYMQAHRRGELREQDRELFQCRACGRIYGSYDEV